MRHAPEAGLDIESLRRERDAVIAKFGVWTDHNILLADGLYTMSEDVASEKLRRILQIVADLSPKPLSELRVLDIACLEGQYAIEFARHGARAMAIEGREPNIEKARFAQRALGLQNLELVLGDVRNLSRETHGTFDVVLCLGILYHLDAPDVLSFLERIGEVCTGLLVVDTYVSLAPVRRYTYQGQAYAGREIVEHTPDQTDTEKMSKLWTSIGNMKSVWLTKPSLLNALHRFGFTSVYECEVPVELQKPLDRITLAAIKGQPVKSLNTPKVNDALPMEMPETMVRRPSHHQRPFAETARMLSAIVPRPVKQQVKSVLRSAGLLRDSSVRWQVAKD